MEKANQNWSDELLKMVKEGKSGFLKAMELMEKNTPLLLEEKLKEETVERGGWLMCNTFVMGVLVWVAINFSPKIFLLHKEASSIEHPYYMGGWMALGIVVWICLFISALFLVNTVIEFIKIKIAQKVILANYIRKLIK